MSKSLKRSLSSLSFSINRLYHMISTTKPSNLIVPALAVAFAVFLFGGGLYDIIIGPAPSVFYQGRFLFVYPSIGDQFISDSIEAMTVYALGIVGLLMMYQSTKYEYKPRQAYMTLIIGVVLLLLAYIFLEATIQYKLHPS